MNEYVVVDASLAVKWLVSEVHSDEAAALARSWVSAGMQPVAPHLMPIEVANALYRRVVRRELSLEVAARLMDSLTAAGIELRESTRLHQRAMALARQVQQSAVYDAHYLALAEMLDCDFRTADERFQRAARTSASYIRWIGEFRGATA